MNTPVVCREVRPAPGNGKLCVVIASQDEREGARALDPTAPSSLPEVRDRLHAQGIALGGPLQPARRCSTGGSPASPVRIIAHDERGKEHRLVADHLEEYSLSSGSTLYYLYVPEAPCDCRWLVGRTLEVAELGGPQPDIAEPGAAADGGRDGGSSEPTASQRGRSC
jgi:hypothetical protein